MAKVKIVKNERDPPLFTGKLLIKFQNILRNTTQVIIQHRICLQMDGHGETSIPPLQLRCGGGGGIIISLGARKPTYLPGVYNTAKIGYGFLYA